MSDDRTLLVAARTMGLAVTEVQRERGLTSAWLAAPTPLLDQEMRLQRLRTDDVLSRLMATPMPGNPGRPADGSGITIDSLASWLSEQRTIADNGSIGARSYRSRMTRKIADLIERSTSGAKTAQSGALALLMRDSSELMWARDALEMERAVGAKIAAQRELGSPPSARDIADMRKHILLRETSLAQFRLVADENTRAAIDLWLRAPTTRAFTVARNALIRPHDQSGALSVTAWLQTSDTTVEALRNVEAYGTERLYFTQRQEMAKVRDKLIRSVLLLVGLFAVFGSLAFMTLYRVDKSIRNLIGTISSLSVDAPTTRVPPCPQKDLNQISNALRILRAAQIERKRNIEAAKMIRSSVDEKLDDVLQAAANGSADRRIDVLGLDAHGAVLARGINRLLDQIEREKAASA